MDDQLWKSSWNRWPITTDLLDETRMLIKARCFHHQDYNCENCLLRALCLPVTLQPQELKTVSQHIEQIWSIHKDEHVFSAGDPFISIYMVKSGALKTVSLSDQGIEQVTGLYLPSEPLGLDSVAFPTSGNTAVALETSAVCEIPFAKLELLCL